MADVSGKTPEKGSIKVITRVATVLSALAEARGGLSLAALASVTDLPKTTVHRICVAAGKRRATCEWTRPAGGAGSGPTSSAWRSRPGETSRTTLEPYLTRLSTRLNETVDLAVLDGESIFFVAQHAAPHRELMAIARVGVHFPAYRMASGKVLLAQMPDEELLRRLPEVLEPTEEAPPKSREAFLDELEEVRHTGLGYEREELRHGICAVAVAVTDLDGRTASIAVPMPTSRFAAGEEVVAEALLQLREEIRLEMGRS